MLCCLSLPWEDPKAADEQQAVASNGFATSGYPGQRRSHNQDPVPFTPIHDNNSLPHFKPQDSDVEIVSVTVPAGISAGETIHVLHPDRSGRIIEAVVPSGVKPGAKFFVHAPLQKTPSMSALAPPMDSPISQSISNSGYEQYSQSMIPTPVPPPSSALLSPPMTAQPVLPPQNQHIFSEIPPPFSQALDRNPSTRYKASNPSTSSSRPSPIHTSPPLPQGNNNYSQTNISMRLVKVKVPPGTKPFSTIHVQIPGENRLVAAQVPPDCTEFHIQYDPTETPTSAILQSPMAQQILSPPAQLLQPEAKLLRVQVPPGTPAGSLLHVQVPNEAGRLIEARVPPNATEFHVSYVPHSQQRTQPYHSSRNQQSGGWESSVLPITGGIASAVVGGMIYDHFAHSRR